MGSKEASSWPLCFLKKEGNLNNMKGEGGGEDIRAGSGKFLEKRGGHGCPT